jgi:hypothetical protein
MSTIQELIIELHEIARENKDIRLDARLRRIADELHTIDKREYIKFLEDRLKHLDEQLEKAMEMLATLMSKMPVSE